VDEGSKQRLASNEAVFRDVNEAIESGKVPAELQDKVAFCCECGELGCNDLIELTIGEYEHVRSNPRRFVIALGHQRPEIETVVESHPGYAVVEKRDEAADVAAETDPRG
jgi:hypothetical protein